MIRLLIVDPRTDADGFGLVTNAIVVADASRAESWPTPDGALVLVDQYGSGVGDLVELSTGAVLRPIAPDPEVDEDGYILNQDGTRMTNAKGQPMTAEDYFI